MRYTVDIVRAKRETINVTGFHGVAEKRGDRMFVFLYGLESDEAYRTAYQLNTNRGQSELKNDVTFFDVVLSKEDNEIFSRLCIDRNAFDVLQYDGEIIGYALRDDSATLEMLRVVNGDIESLRRMEIERIYQHSNLSGFNIVDSDGWEYDGKNTFSRWLFVKNPDDEVVDEEGDVTKAVALTITFKEGSAVGFTVFVDGKRVY